jgi:hypothetical protein
MQDNVANRFVASNTDVEGVSAIAVAAFANSNAQTIRVTSAWAQANAAQTVAILAFGAANTAQGTATGAFANANAQTIRVTSAWAQANAAQTVAILAYDKANLAATFANDASTISTGTLAVARGGTGLNTLTLNGVLVGNGTNQILVTSAGVEGKVLQANTTGMPFFGDVDGGFF